MADGTVGAHGIYPFDSGCKSPFPSRIRQAEDPGSGHGRGGDDLVWRVPLRASVGGPVIGIEAGPEPAGESGQAMGMATVDEFDTEPDALGPGEWGFKVVAEVGERRAFGAARQRTMSRR